MHTLTVLAKDMTALAKVTTSSALACLASPANRARVKSLAQTLIRHL